MNRLHPLSGVLFAFQYATLWASLLVVGMITLSGLAGLDSGFLIPAVLILGIVFGLGYGITYYYRFGYQVTDSTFDVASGVVARRAREIPYRRIQNVDIRQGVLQRVLGLAAVSIETAGGGDSEATLTFVSEAEATRLQQSIRRRTARARGSGRASESPDPEADDTHQSADSTAVDLGSGAGESVQADDQRRHRLFDLQSRELLLYSFTTFQPAAVAAVGFLVVLMSDSIIDFLVAIAQPLGGPDDLETGTTGSYGVLTIVSVINGIVITYLLSVAYTFATYYDFQLGRVDEDFVYERGLLQRYSGSIPAEKVQSVTVTDNPAQRLIDYAGLWVETAGYGPDNGSGSQSAVPLAEKQRVYGFAETLTGSETPRFRRPGPIARRRYLARYSLIAGALVAIAFGIAQVTVLERWYLAAIAFLVVPVAAHLRYVHLGYFVGENHLVIRRGFWRRRTTVIPYYRIQTVSIRRSIFQRRLGIGSVVVDTASSSTFSTAAPTIYDVSLETARNVTETSRNRLQSALRERARSDDLGVTVDFTEGEETAT